MEKIIDVLVILLGLLLIVPGFGVTLPDWVFAWIAPILIIGIGIVKLISDYLK